MLSSTKRIWALLGPVLPNKISLISFSWCAHFRRAENLCIPKRDIYEERRSPCPKPCEGTNMSESPPLSLTETRTQVTHLITIATQPSAKPIINIICSRKIHSTLSYAFIMSNSTARSSVFLFLVQMACTHSYAVNTLSAMSHPGTKALVPFEISTAKLAFNQLDRTFGWNLINIFTQSNRMKLW